MKNLIFIWTIFSVTCTLIISCNEIEKSDECKMQSNLCSSDQTEISFYFDDNITPSDTVNVKLMNHSQDTIMYSVYYTACYLHYFDCNER